MTHYLGLAVKPIRDKQKIVNKIRKILTYLQINLRPDMRGSPSLVGRGIANPMSAMTRGFKSLSPRH
jgi:hypothetical protein